MDRDYTSRPAIHRGGAAVGSRPSSALSTSSALSHGSRAVAPAFAPVSTSPHLLNSQLVSSTHRGSDGVVSAASSPGVARSPAVWLVEERPRLPPGLESGALTAAEDEGGTEVDDDDDEEEQRRRESERRGRHDRVWQERQQQQQQRQSDLQQQHAQPWVVDGIELGARGTPEAPSPRVLDNRIQFHPSSLPASERREHASWPALYHKKAAVAQVSAPPDDGTEEGADAAAVGASAAASTVAHASPAASRDTAATAARGRVEAARHRLTSPPPPSRDAAARRGTPPLRTTALPTHDSNTSTTAAASTQNARGASRASSRSPSPDSAPDVINSSVPSPPPFMLLQRADTADAHVTGGDVSGLGPLMVVHLDVLPPLRPLHAGTQRGIADDTVDGTLEDRAALVAAVRGTSTSLTGTVSDGCAEDDANAALAAFLMDEVHGSQTRELAALYAKLEMAEQRIRVAEQQVGVAAEARAAELVQDYKADERKRRAQFQATLDTLREENRDLIAKLEAAARAPALGLSSAAPPSTTSSTGVAAASSVVVARGAGGEAELGRQLQAVEAYWRDRLRTAERHWEDEMARQSRQRREALDQVDELVRTVEQSQEELRFTRRQAARLREENARLTTAAAGLATTSTLSNAGGAGEEVGRLRQAVREHEHREAALLAQVESYGEEATQLRVRYETALAAAQQDLAAAQQDLAAERRRSAEMVKLYGSQLESLHHQLREAKAANA